MRSYAILNISSTLRAGDTISWTDSLSDYPATSGWTLAYALRAKDKSAITITASTSGTDFLISVLPSASKAWNSGIYSWQAYVYKGPSPDFTERVTIGTGTVEILPDLFLVGTQTDLRSHVKKVLDAIESILEGKSTTDVMAYSIAGRSISKMNPTELLKWRDLYRSEYQRELDAEGVAKGLDSGRRIGVRFQKI